jgi:drug/metabolite transporter (DMT)-like permease
MRVALFSLAPVIAVVLEPYLGASPLGGDRGLPGMSGLMGALTAVAGTLCVFPLQIPGSIEAAAAVGAVILAAACVAAANCGAVRLARALKAKAIAPMAAIAGAAAAAGLASASALTERAAWRWEGIAPELGRAVVFELPGLLLLFWLMQRMSAARMTTRFVLAPLMTILIGMALERPAVGLRTWAGLVLIAAGAGWLLFAPAEEPGADFPSLRLYRGGA